MIPFAVNRKVIEDEYWRLAEFEHHFNDIETRTRIIAATWMVVAFGAIAVLVQQSGGTTNLLSYLLNQSNGAAKWLIPPAALISLVCLMATVGLFVIWIIDQLVYHRLLESVFLIGLKLEHDNDWLPPLRTMMMVSAESKGMSRWIRLYYLIPILVFITVSVAVPAISLPAIWGQTMRVYQIFCISLICIAAQVGIAVYMAVKGKEILPKESVWHLEDHTEDNEEYDFVRHFYDGPEQFEKYKRLVEEDRKERRKKGFPGFAGVASGWRSKVEVQSDPESSGSHG